MTHTRTDARSDLARAEEIKEGDILAEDGAQVQFTNLLRDPLPSVRET